VSQRTQRAGGGGVSDRVAGLTRARKAWRKIIESMSTDQVQDLLTSVLLVALGRSASP